MYAELMCQAIREGNQAQSKLAQMCKYDEYFNKWVKQDTTNWRVRSLCMHELLWKDKVLEEIND